MLEKLSNLHSDVEDLDTQEDLTKVLPMSEGSL